MVKLRSFSSLYSSLSVSSMMASTVELSTRKEQSKSNNLSDNWIRIIEYIAKFKTELWMLHGNWRKNCKLFEFLFEILRFVLLNCRCV